MKLRIIAGQLKRRYIEITGKAAHFRPTKEIVREAVADFLNRNINGARVADICAGSGAFGFEMISRGAQMVCFIENYHARCEYIRKYIHLFNVEDKCRVIKRDVRSYLKKCRYTFDIIYYDPPYDDVTLTEVIPAILPCIATDGILIFERRRRPYSYPSLSGSVSIETRTYGDTVLDFLTCQTENE